MFKFWQTHTPNGKKLRKLQDKAGVETGKAFEKADTLLKILHRDTVYILVKTQLGKAK